MLGRELDDDPNLLLLSVMLFYPKCSNSAKTKLSCHVIPQWDPRMCVPDWENNTRSVYRLYWETAELSGFLATQQIYLFSWRLVFICNRVQLGGEEFLGHGLNKLETKNPVMQACRDFNFLELEVTLAMGKPSWQDFSEAR